MSTASIGAARGGRDERSGTTARVGMILAAVALLGLLAAWFFGWVRFSTDPRVAEIQKMQEEARATFMANGGPSTAAEAEAAVAAMRQIRDKVEALPAGLKREVDRGGRSVFRSTMRARIDAYFAATPKDRQALLDRQIKQEELMRQAFEQAGGGGGPPGGGQQAGGQQGGGRQWGGGPPSNGTEEDRNRWRKNMIDSTSPDQRARYVEYRRVMDKRREELGLPPRGPR